MPTALEIIETEIEQAQETVIETTVDELSSNLDELPVVGFGLSLFSSSVESAMMQKVEQEIVPDLEAHTEKHLEHVRAVVDGDEAQPVHNDFEEQLLETNPVWTMLDDDETVRQEVREKTLEHSNESARLLAEWVAQADGEEFSDMPEMAAFLDMSGAEVADHLKELLYYVDLMVEYRDHLDPGVYSSVLSHAKIRDWFIDHLLTGLQDGREQETTRVATTIDEWQSEK